MKVHPLRSVEQFLSKSGQEVFANHEHHSVLATARRCAIRSSAESCQSMEAQCHKPDVWPCFSVPIDKFRHFLTFEVGEIG